MRRKQLRAALMVFLSSATGPLLAQSPMPKTAPTNPAQEQVDVRLLPPLPIQIGKLQRTPEGSSNSTSVQAALSVQGSVRKNPHTAVRQLRPVSPAGALQLIPAHEEFGGTTGNRTPAILPASDSSTGTQDRESGFAHFTFSDQTADTENASSSSSRDQKTASGFSAQFSLSDRESSRAPKLALPIGLDGISVAPTEDAPELEPMSTPATLLRVAPRSPLVVSAPIEFEAIDSTELPTASADVHIVPAESLAESKLGNAQGDGLDATPSMPTDAPSSVHGDGGSEDTSQSSGVAVESDLVASPTGEGSQIVDAITEGILPLGEHAEENAQTQIASPFARLEPVSKNVTGTAETVAPDSTIQSEPATPEVAPILPIAPIVPRRVAENVARDSAEPPKSVMQRGPFADVVSTPVELSASSNDEANGIAGPVVTSVAEIYRPKKQLVIDTTAVEVDGDDSSKSQDEVSAECFERPVSSTTLVPIAETASISPNEPVKRVQLQDREICDAVLVNPYKLLLIGRKPGATKLAIWFGQNSVPEVREVRVVESQPTMAGASLETVAKRLTETIAATHPGCRVIVIPNGDGLTVRGQATDSKAAKAIMRLVRNACLKTVNDQLEVR